MPSPRETRALLQTLTAEAADLSVGLISQFAGPPDVRRAALLESVPEVISAFSDGSSALAVDFYDEQRLAAGETSRFTSRSIVQDRTVKIRRAIVWAAEPLQLLDDTQAGKRLAEVVQLETARPFRDTITGNRQRDPSSVGWRRVTAGGCKLCRMLADRGAVYKESTARFAAHPNCHCTAQPVFGADDFGPEASAMQYMASRRSRSPQQKQALRDYLDSFY